MDPVTPFDWHRLFIGVQPPGFFAEIAIRIVLVYVFAVLVLRFLGKRGRRQMSTFELVLVIALGSATGDAMLYPEVPILYAWLIILLMVALGRLIDLIQLRSKSANDFLEGKPRPLIRDGEINQANLRLEGLRRDEMMALLREHEIADTGEVAYAFLEVSGNLGVIRRSASESVEPESTLPSETP